MATREGQHLRLLSYNIQAGAAAQGFHHYLTQGWKQVLPHAKLLDNLNHIAYLIQDYQLAALQEVDAGSLRSGFVNQTQYLASRADFPFWYSQTNRDLGHFAQVSIGLLARLRPTQVTRHKLPGPIPGRGLMLALFGHGEKRLAVLVVHLALGRLARIRQTAYIARLVSQFEHAVVMGDFNFQSESQEMARLLRSTRLREPTDVFYTFPSWRPRRSIDHILVTPDLRVLDARVLPYPLSDHLPIAMELEIPAEIDLG